MIHPDAEIPRELRRGQRPFDPIALTRITERIVCKSIGKEMARKYTSFRVVRFYKGAATGFVVGCNLRCFFCWSDPSRDYPERYGSFYTPSQVVENLVRISRSRRCSVFRVSGGEPTLCREHLVQLLKFVEERSEIKTFVLETNGILLGYDPSYVKDLANACSKLVVRVSIKAGYGEKFWERCGAEPSALNYVFKAIENLVNEGVETYVAILLDPRLVSVDERRAIMTKLAEIDPRLVLEYEEETIEAFPNALRRMKIYGYVLR